MKIYLALLLAIVASSTASSEEKQSPTDEFRGTSQYHIMMCQLKTKTALMKVEAGELDNAFPIISACLKEGRAEIKKVFPPALAKVSKKPAAAKLLKD